jgi:hypothetical protein
MLQRANKRGLSEIIGYVLLVSFAIVMATVVYSWMKSYVPQDTIECEEGVSIFVERSNCVLEEGINKLNLKIKNNGRFNIDGIFVYGANSTEDVATIDLSPSLVGGDLMGSAIRFSGGKALNPGDSAEFNFELETAYPKIQIVAARYEEIGDRKRFAICSNAKISQEITCE